MSLNRVRGRQQSLVTVLEVKSQNVTPTSYRSLCLPDREQKVGMIMAAHLITCVTTEFPHRHILKVGIGDNRGNTQRYLSVTDVRNQLDAGDTFETLSPSSGKRASVKKDTCKIDGCAVNTIRSHSDVEKDNNLDNLKACN